MQGGADIWASQSPLLDFEGDILAPPPAKIDGFVPWTQDVNPKNVSARALPTETKVESGTSQRKMEPLLT